MRLLPITCLLLVACGFTLARPPATFAQDPWAGNLATGNMAKNPGFEEDFVNRNAEGHVLSFKGDWYYNQQDRIPDYWNLRGSWEWASDRSRGRTLKLNEGATADQSFVRAVYQTGGGAWGGSQSITIPVAEDEVARFTRPWRVSVWCRGAGTLTVQSGGAPAVSTTGKPGSQWQSLVVDLPVESVGPPNAGVSVKLAGPAEFDEVVVQEKQPATPNLVANAGFEKLDGDARPVGWSQQLKYRAIGPTYYVWTDWNHAFRANRGQVGADALIAHSGRHSLRFDVHPGDEKLVESDLILINQDQPRVIEVGAFVRADRIKLIDVRCVDQDGCYMPGYRARQPEYKNGGTFLFGNGNFEWRYVRKFFAPPNGKPVKGIRVRLCARGMNGHTLDDGGTRAYAMQTGTVWWDDVRVFERTSDAASLQRRQVKLPPQNGDSAGTQATIDLGQRYFGQNVLAYAFTHVGAAATWQIQLSTTFPGGEPVVTKSRAVRANSGQRVQLPVSYQFDQLAGELEKQGTLQVQLLRDGKLAAESTYRFNTWPDVVDIDISRHYSLPNENPVTASLNLGVADATLARTRRLELQLVRASDGALLGTRSFSDLKKAFADTLAALPTQQADSFEFNMPKPDWWADRTNLIVTALDLSKLKIWPHNEPTRDTVLVVRGLDARGQELFRDESDPFGRVQPPPRQPPIKSVAVREDGAVLLNGQPRFLTGATHQNNRTTHTLPLIQQLGLMGHRLTQGMTFAQHDQMWREQGLYSLQMKPANKIGGTVPVVDLTAAQKHEFEQFVRSGGMRNVISINTGGWEATINVDDPAAVKQHAAFNDYVRRVSGRPVAISTSGAFNAWWIPKLTWYDINHAETEMWGPMDFNVIFTPYMKAARKQPTAWVYLPQLYDNHPFERYRFETYENIIRGSAGVSMIQGIGDPSFNRGLAGELRYLEAPLNSLEKAPAVKLEPNISHKVTRYQDKTYVLATNAGPVQVGNWSWDAETKHSGRASHEGDSVNQMWVRPGGVRIHGFRGMPLPAQIQKGDKIVQYVWLDPRETPQWVMLCVRGNGRFAHNTVLGQFDFKAFQRDYGNILMYSELNHSVWHEINWVMDDATYQRGVRIMGKAWADRIRNGAAAGRQKVDQVAYQANHFHNAGALPKAGEWVRIELDAERAGLTGKLVDGFAWLTKNGRALWDFTVLERNGEVARVFCEDSVGIDRERLASVRIDVPGLKKGAKVKVLFENRTVTADDGGFADTFSGTDTYGYEAGGVSGDMFGFVKDPDRELARMIPSGYGYSYGPTAVHIYEIDSP